MRAGRLPTGLQAGLLAWLVHRLPLVTRRTHEEAVRNAFELGCDAGALGLRRAQRKATTRHLRSIR